MKKALLFILGAVTWMNCSGQLNGSLDSTFSGNGFYSYDFGFHDNLNDVTLQPDQKVICTGVAISQGFSGVHLKVMRLHTDGTPDSTFATNGVFSLLLGVETYGYESYVQADGKIIVAGITYDTNYVADWLLLRLNNEGILDQSFGTNGITTLDFYGQDDIAQAMTVQADGKILVSGTHKDIGNYYNNPTIVRFTSNGFVDSTFGINGGFSMAGLHIDNELTSIAVQQDGKIVAGGHYSKLFTGSSDFDVLVIRLDTAGSLDVSFGLNGVVKTSVNGGIDDSFGLEIDTSGNIYVAGFTTLPFTLYYDMILIKYNSNGIPDPAFGTGGIVTFNNANEDVAYDLKIQPDQKIVVGGSSGLSFLGPRDLALWRYLPNGTPDNTFGTNGFITITMAPTFQDCNSLALQADGKIVGAGRLNNGSQNDVVVARFLNSISTTVNQLDHTAVIRLYPNPALQNQVVTLLTEKPVQQDAHIEMYTVTGEKLVMNNALIPSGTYGVQFSTPAGISSGIYFILLHNGNEVTRQALVVE